MGKFFSAIIGFATLFGIGIVGSFLVLPAFYESAGTSPATMLFWLQLGFLLVSTISAFFYAYSVLLR